MMTTPLVSVIIPTKNAGKVVGKCLKSMRSQSYKNIEIIVVDNHSQDNTLDVAKSFADKVLTKGPERSVQRNFGVSRSSGDYIAWFDADMVLQKNVIKESVDLFKKNREIAGLIIPERSVGKGFWAKCRALEKRCYLRDEKIEGLRFIKKSIFKQVGMFSPNFISGEDWDITIRVKQKGYKIERIKSFVLHNEGNLSLLSDLRKKYYYSTQSLPYVNRHVKSPMDILTFIFRPAFIRNWKLLSRKPLLTLGMFFMKFMEFSAGFIGLIRAKTRKL